jgi:hypothetical protein
MDWSAFFDAASLAGQGSFGVLPPGFAEAAEALGGRRHEDDSAGAERRKGARR